MLFIKNNFYKQLKNCLSKKNFQIDKKIKDDLYEISSGNVSLVIDTCDARRDYDYGKNSETLDNLLLRIEHDFTAKSKLVSFHTAQQSLRVLLMRDEDIKDNYITSDFLENIKKVVVFSTDNNNIYPLDSEYLKKWGMPKDVIFSVCDKNMCDILRAGNLQVSVIAGMIKVVEFTSVCENLRASLLTCSSFKKHISELLGSRFLVVIPSASSILAVEDVRNDIIETFGQVVVDNYVNSKSKLSTDVYLYGANGISVAGRFNVKETVTQ